MHLQCKVVRKHQNLGVKPLQLIYTIHIPGQHNSANLYTSLSLLRSSSVNAMEPSQRYPTRTKTAYTLASVHWRYVVWRSDCIKVRGQLTQRQQAANMAMSMRPPVNRNTGCFHPQCNNISTTPPLNAPEPMPDIWDARKYHQAAQA